MRLMGFMSFMSFTCDFAKTITMSFAAVFAVNNHHHHHNHHHHQRADCCACQRNFQPLSKQIGFQSSFISSYSPSNESCSNNEFSGSSSSSKSSSIYQYLTAAATSDDTTSLSGQSDSTCAAASEEEEGDPNKRVVGWSCFSVSRSLRQLTHPSPPTLQEKKFIQNRINSENSFKESFHHKSLSRKSQFVPPGPLGCLGHAPYIHNF